MTRNTVSAWDPVRGCAVGVPGHPMDREQEITVEEARRAHLNGELDADDLPLVVESDMSADPCEGVQGSYTAVVEAECPECPSEFGLESMHTFSAVGCTNCLLCDYLIAEY